MPDFYPNEYFEYLSKKFDIGSSNSPVLSAFDYCINFYNDRYEFLRVLDAGCFNGAMLNRINKDLNSNRFVFYGIDLFFSPLSFGIDKYKDIKLCCGCINNDLPFPSDYFNIIIVSNIFHEIYSQALIDNDFDYSIAYTSLQKAISNLKYCLARNGLLIIQEGIKPDNPEKKIVVEFLSNETKTKFDTFLKEFFLKFDVKELNYLHKEMTINCLSTFLTKSKYIGKNSWEHEKRQLYQILNKDTFLKMFSELELKIIFQKKELINKKHINNQIRFQHNNFSLPVKNTTFILEKM